MKGIAMKGFEGIALKAMPSKQIHTFRRPIVDPALIPLP